jgi:hypothetical protein
MTAAHEWPQDDPAVVQMFNGICERAGGPHKFTLFQLELALNIARLTQTLHAAAPLERVRISEVVMKMHAQLPPPLPPPPREVRIRSGASVKELARLYAQMLRGDDSDLVDIDADGEIVEATVVVEPATSPQAAAHAPRRSPSRPQTPP